MSLKIVLYPSQEVKEEVYSKGIYKGLHYINENVGWADDDEEYY